MILSLCHRRNNALRSNYPAPYEDDGRFDSHSSTPRLPAATTARAVSNDRYEALSEDLKKSLESSAIDSEAR